MFLHTKYVIGFCMLVVLLFVKEVVDVMEKVFVAEKNLLLYLRLHHKSLTKSQLGVFQVLELMNHYNLPYHHYGYHHLSFLIAKYQYFFVCIEVKVFMKLYLTIMSYSY